MELFGSNKSKISKDKNGENVYFIVILLTMIINKIQESCIHLFLINRLVNYYIFFLKVLCLLKKSKTEFVCIEVWFTDQNYKPLEIEDKIDATLVIN